jgi:DNA-binding PadR family transcriptional regulator
MSNKPTPLPGVTHLQFLVLTLVADGKPLGRAVRDELRRHGIRRTGPAFYQMMARLEEAGLVEGWYEQKVVDGQLLKERRYRATPAGRRAWAGTRDFYGAVLAARPRRRWSDA